MTDPAEEMPNPPPLIQLRRIRKPRDVRRGLLRVANAVLAGQIPVPVGNHAVLALSAIGRIMETEMFDERLAALEAAMPAADQPKTLRLVGRG